MRRKSRLMRFLSCLIAACVIAGMLPAAALAAEGDPSGEVAGSVILHGDGTIETDGNVGAMKTEHGWLVGLRNGNAVAPMTIADDGPVRGIWPEYGSDADGDGVNEHDHNRDGWKCYGSGSAECGMTPHVHDDEACYTVVLTDVLVCGLAEDGHEHSADCYSGQTAERLRTCMQEEHGHVPGCYAEDDWTCEAPEGYWSHETAVTRVSIEDHIASNGVLRAVLEADDAGDGAYPDVAYQWYEIPCRVEKSQDADGNVAVGVVRDGDPEPIEGAGGSELYVFDGDGAIVKAPNQYLVEAKGRGNDEPIASAVYQAIYYDELQNGSFEAPAISDDINYGKYMILKPDNRNGPAKETSRLWWVDESEVTGSWKRMLDDIYLDFAWRSTTGDFEVFSAKSNFHMASNAGIPDGDQAAELNADSPGTLYQFILTKPGSKMYWSFWHRGRSGVDKMGVYAGAEVPDVILDGSGNKIGTDTKDAELLGYFETDRFGWTRYSGEYEVPEGQYVTCFRFVPESTYNGNLTYGNLLDDVKLTFDFEDVWIGARDGYAGYRFNYYVNGQAERYDFGHVENDDLSATMTAYAKEETLRHFEQHAGPSYLGPFRLDEATGSYVPYADGEICLELEAGDAKELDVHYFSVDSNYIPYKVEWRTEGDTEEDRILLRSQIRYAEPGLLGHEISVTDEDEAVVFAGAYEAFVRAPWSNNDVKSGILADPKEPDSGGAMTTLVLIYDDSGPGFELPETGGIGTAVFHIAGAFAMAAACGFCLASCRGKSRKASGRG